MQCSSCSKKINPKEAFCPHCGTRTGLHSPNDPGFSQVPREPSLARDEGTDKGRKYKPLFVKLFWFGVAVHIFAGVADIVGDEIVDLLLFTAITFFIYKVCMAINNAMVSIGKKHWWPLGLLSLIPIGVVVVFYVMRSKLKPHDKW